jgi:predicted lipid carrier protein YhbT
VGNESLPPTPGFDTEALARIVRSTPDDQLAEGLRQNRDVLLAEVFRRFPERLAAAGRRQNAVIKWKIGGRDDGGYDRWFLVLRDGRCEVARDLAVRPRVTLTVGALDFLKIVTGNANPAQMFLSRRLKVRGDLVYAARLQRFFTVPSRNRPGH